MPHSDICMCMKNLCELIGENDFLKDLHVFICVLSFMHKFFMHIQCFSQLVLKGVVVK